jgi:hypothetical protein
VPVRIKIPPPCAVDPLVWLALSWQVVSKRVVFSLPIPAPWAVLEKLTRLLLIWEPEAVAAPPAVTMPPPREVAGLLLIVAEATFSGPRHWRCHRHSRRSCG